MTVVNFTYCNPQTIKKWRQHVEAMNIFPYLWSKLLYTFIQRGEADSFVLKAVDDGNQW